jgi:uncharacterized membrane protein YheB (UPF0754 family)
MYILLLLFLECFAVHFTVNDKISKTQLSDGLKNSKATIQNIIGVKADFTAKLFQSRVTKDLAGCARASCKETIKRAANKLTVLALAPVAVPVKLAANHIENRAAQMAAKKVIKNLLHFLPNQMQDSVKESLESMAKDLMRLMCQYKISGNKEKIAFANAVQQRLSENPKVNQIMLSASVGIVCLAARMPS